MTTTTPTNPTTKFIKLLFGVLIFATLVSLCSAPSKKSQTATQQITEKPQPVAKKQAAPVKPKPKPKPIVSKVTFYEVNRLFAHDSGLTELQKDEAWKDYKGLCVEWTGEVADIDSQVISGFSVGMKHLRSTLTYDVLIDAPSSQKETLLSWQQGTRRTYRATLVSYGGAFSPISADWGCK